jgi:hypothetical protein
VTQSSFDKKKRTRSEKQRTKLVFPCTALYRAAQIIQSGIRDAELRGHPSQDTLSVPAGTSCPKLAELQRWLIARVDKLSKRSDLAEAIHELFALASPYSIS